MQPAEIGVDLNHQYGADVQEPLATDLYGDANVLETTLPDQKRVKYPTDGSHDEQGSHCAAVVCSYT